ncbi:phosphoribosylamine--glycine ligase [Mangrovibacillus cuniculi]|uniref:Phosphoribosylamine--glycine ligase n=1 Tax=Mangrovibacillus cuniculi TaxID=2593652 RepID=A0A7S8C940_9BACI|nr:phosphoribosylamine--glycine ligase [Mangrovibacillus cuniculi]QPC45493.1 phosphoribosylamine--glycine ligase [Mangrovibacillus cuniculi]
MKVLVIGRGGREHALVHMCTKSSLVEEVYCAPGSDAIGAMAQLVNVQETDVKGLATFAEEAGIGLTIVGPEVPLLAGIVDQFQQRGLLIFGPSQKAAQLEGSKSFAKAFMDRHGIPTASYEVATGIEAVISWCAKVAPPYVLKADGLAAGKGVVIALTKQEAVDTALSFFDGQLGDAGKTIVLEEYLDGEECSFMVMANGENFVTLPISQDHKRLLEEDQGPNTGGMGVIAPLEHVRFQWQSFIEENIITPTLRGMLADGITYQGVLYAGLMITEDGPKVIEFNARFGDPETQVVLPMAESDLVVTMLQLLNEEKVEKVVWREDFSIGVVLAGSNYPVSSSYGEAVELIETADGNLYHAGTTWSNERGGWLTNGGRVALYQAFGNTLQEAQQLVYQVVDQVVASGSVRARRDIGNKLIEFVSESVGQIRK